MVQQVTQVTSEIPEVLEPYFTGDPDAGITGIMPKAQELFGKGFDQVYGAGAQSLMGLGGIAPMSASQQELGRQIAGLEAPGAFTTAQQAQEAGIQGLLAAPGRFDSAAAQAYMSPFMENVVDIEQRKAIDAAKKAQLDANLASARQGTYGGARQALLTGARESGLRTQLGDIRSRGLQAAFENAQKQFGADRAAQIAAAQGLGTLGQQQGALGVQQQAAELDRLKTLGAFGDLERAIMQEGLSAEGAFQRRRDEFGQQQLGNLANILRGVPTTDTTQTTAVPPPSFASQLTGLGITGLSLAKLLGG
tara:strand:- start:2261 stop:3181 length:921 start_codon:yes stop_codon:yes gene_type:complete